MPKPLRCIILGAAGRDFHDFLMFFRQRADFQVVAFNGGRSVANLESTCVFENVLVGERPALMLAHMLHPGDEPRERIGF